MKNRRATRNRKHKKVRVTSKHRKCQRGGTWRGIASGPVGISWSGNPKTWPGVASKNGITQSNHYPVSKYGVPAGLPDSPLSTSNLQGGPIHMTGGGDCHCSHKGGTRKAGTRKQKSMRRRQKLSRRRRHRQKGGSIRNRLLPMDIVNTGRKILNSPAEVLNTWNGLEQPANLDPSPTSQPISKSENASLHLGGTKITSNDTQSQAPPSVNSAI